MVERATNFEGGVRELEGNRSLTIVGAGGRGGGGGGISIVTC